MRKFNELLNHIKNWNEWRKHNRNSKLHQILVLFKFKHSPTFNYSQWEDMDFFRESETVCDKCPKLDECISSGAVINITGMGDTKQHYLRNVCCENNQ